MPDEAPGRPVRVLAGCGFVAILGLLSWAIGVPALFPAVGPSVLMLVHPSPAPRPRPLSVLLGHLVGAGAGAGALTALGLWHAPGAIASGFTAAHALAATLAMTVVVAASYLEPLHHPPAAATTLLVSLGAMVQPRQLAGLGIGIVLTWLLAVGLERPGTGRSRHGRDTAPRTMTPRA